MRSNWSIRSKIIAMITVPLTALFALWVFATVLTVGPAFNLLSTRTLQDYVGNPAEVLVSQLQQERRLSVQFLSDSSAAPSLMAAQRDATDRAAADFRKAAGSDDAQGAASTVLRDRIGQLLTAVAQLPGNRGHIDRREMDPIGAQGLYNSMVDAGFEVFLAAGTLNDETMDREVRGLVAVGRAQEYLSRIDSLLASATVSGRFTDDVRSELVQDVGTARFLLADGVGDLPPASRVAYGKISSSTAFTQLNTMMDRLVVQSRSGAISPVGADTWHPAYVQSSEQLQTFGLDAGRLLSDEATPLAVKILLRLGAAGVLGLIALVVAIVVSVKVGRSIVGRLRRLRAEALEMAGERLPTVVRRLQRGEMVDVEVETPPLEYGRDEIGQLGQAFNDVQRTAVQSAVEEASVRRGLNEVFLNIARRSQTLLHRQLALLDKMERRETEPQELEDLYRVDHLATRMRRHAEDLVILAGAAPGRGWRNPVPFIDVIRGAISEVEDYKRIDIRSLESSALLGRAVGDVIHLLAELLENAASYSPPHTRVQVTGQVLPNGYAMEIEDRGLGMAHEAIDEANRRLVEPPDFDPADSARLGLFVVAQLAGRHGIRVSLRQSAFGGVTAIVLVPGELVVAATGPAALPPGPDKGRERPLVGSGTDDPSRHSLAALQWQGTEELRQLTATGRPVTLNGVVAPERESPGRNGGVPPERESPGRNDGVPTERELPGRNGGVPPELETRGGPAPSSVADGLSAEGLVRRRRSRRPVDLGSADRAPTAEPAGVDLSAAAAALRSGAADPVPVDDDGLPKRVRQASLAPQLRQTPGEIAEEPTVPMRSPEEARTLMNALQLGTTRGRIDASRYVEPAKGVPSNVGSFEDAATVILPAIADDAAARGEAPSGAGEDAVGDRADGPRQSNVTRPEKDA
jgi:signal transduction histidine kinase